MTRPILVARRLRDVDGKLLDLLRDLAPGEWDLPTIVPGWQVRDVAAHLLDTALRKLSLARDGWFVERPEIRSAADVSALVNRMNREGVIVYRRLSPAVLCRLMAAAVEESADFHESLDPFAPALFPVSWAGDSQSPNWFDTARELTERWHHQQQIRLAVGRPGIETPEWYGPVLDCFARGLPHAFHDVEAAPGTRVMLEVTGECGGKWWIRRGADGWRFDMPGACDARAAIPQEIAWRVFTKGIPREQAIGLSVLEGNRALAEAVFGLVAIVA